MGHLPGVEKVINARRSEGGRDEETIAELKARAPAILRSRNCALTAGDIEKRATEAGGVLKAKAIPLAHPDHPDVEVPGAVTVVIVPDNKDIKPVPSSDLIRATCGYLERYRPITMELNVTGPHYQHVKMEVLVVAERYASLDAVAERVTKALNESEYLDPRKQEFGRDIYPSRFYDTILDVADVRSVKNLTVYQEGREQPLNEQIKVPPGGLLYATHHEIVVVRSDE
jgi:predicted phage baseplate assembly protein